MLVVEDNPITQLVTLEALRKLGCRSKAASFGAEAVEARREDQFDLLLLDCHLPDMDGFATSRAIREFERSSAGHRVSIVAVTADRKIECVDRCLAAGMDGHVRKPVTIDVLGELLARYLS